MFKFVLCKIKYCKKSYLSKITLYDIRIRMEADRMQNPDPHFN